MSFRYFAFVSWASFVELFCIEHTQLKQFPFQPLSQGDNWMRISIRYFYYFPGLSHVCMGGGALVFRNAGTDYRCYLCTAGVVCTKAAAINVKYTNDNGK